MFIKLDFNRYLWGEIASAAIAAGASIVGNYQRNEAQRRENEKAYLREKQQIEEMNAYNSASAQAARLQAAGLNPNLMYGQSPAQAAGQQNDIAHYQPAEVTNAFGNVGETLGSTAQSLVGIREQENQNMLAEMDVLLKGSTIELQSAQMNWDNTQAKVALEMLGYNKELISAQAENYRTQSTLNVKSYDKIDADIEEARANRDVLKKKLDLMDKESEQLDALIRNLDAKSVEILTMLPEQARYVHASADERMAMCVTAAHQWALYDAETNLKIAQEKQIPEEIAKWKKELEILQSANSREWFDSIAGKIMDVATFAGAMYMGGASVASSVGSVTSRVGYGFGRARWSSAVNSPKRTRVATKAPTGNRKKYGSR